VRTIGDGDLDDIPPGILPLCQLVGKPVIQHQVLQVWVTLVCVLDVIQEASTDDAATLQVTSNKITSSDMAVKSK